MALRISIVFLALFAGVLLLEICEQASAAKLGNEELVERIERLKRSRGGDRTGTGTRNTGTTSTGGGGRIGLADIVNFLIALAGLAPDVTGSILDIIDAIRNS